MKKPTLIVIVVALLVVTMMACNRELNSTKDTKTGLTDVIKSSTCAGNPIARAKEYDSSPGIHKIAVSGNLAIPEHWIAEFVEETELVICLSDGEEHIETCFYTGGATVQRYRKTKTVRILAAKTGELIAEEILLGDNPNRCPNTIYSSHSIHGPAVTDEAVVAYLKTFVE